MGKTIVATVTSKVLHGWLWLEETALEKRGHRQKNWWRQQPLCTSDVGDDTGVGDGGGCQQEDGGTTTHSKGNTIGPTIIAQHEDPSNDNKTTTGDSPSPPLLFIDKEENSFHHHHHHHGLQNHQTRFVSRCLQQVALLIVCAALIAYYAFVHVRIIQQEDHVFYTAWFYEWFMIPVLLSFVFAAPLHRSLGCPCHNKRNVVVDDEQQQLQQQQEDEDCWRERLALVERDPTTQRLVVAVGVCYVAYIVGDVSFFVPLSPNHAHLATFVIYLLAVLTNMAFIYQGFLLSILAMRVMVLRLRHLEAEISLALQLETNATAPMRTMQDHTNNTTTTTRLTRQQITHWINTYQTIRQDMQSLSTHFGKRMVIGITMFVVEVTTIILNVSEAIGSSLTILQRLWLLLTYSANAAVLIMVTFQTASMATRCTEYIGPQLALLSLRSTHSKSDLNVLAQGIQQAPIRLRAGTFDVTAEYANALMAWFFGLFLLVFGMKLPNI